MGRGGWRRWSAVAAVALALPACSGHGSGGGSKAAAAKAAPTSALAGPQPTPKPNLRAAVETLLTDEQRNDHAASFLLLSPGSRQSDFHNADLWAHRRSELAPITKFAIEQQKGDTVVVLVEHKPGLDPFTGLAVAKEHQSWRGGEGAGGYLVDGGATLPPEDPPHDGAKPATLAWARAVQACDQAKAESQQAANPLFGSQPAAAGGLCHSTGDITVGAVSKLPPGPTSQDLVAQYSSDALEWARSVAVTAPSGSFHVLLAPIGTTWQVVGLAD